jgi:hypothetical protein
LPHYDIIGAGEQAEMVRIGVLPSNFLFFEGGSKGSEVEAPVFALRE